MIGGQGNWRSVAELRPYAAEYLGAYADPGRDFAFACYDQAPIHDGPLTASDVLMANLLSLKLGWSDVIPLFSTAQSRFTGLRQVLDAALIEARQLPRLEDCDDEQVAMPALRKANETAAATAPYVPNTPKKWTAVTVSKVLHRLAPTVPIIDSRVRAFYGTTWPGIIRKRMRDDLDVNRNWLTDLAESYPVRGQAAPLTRVADILIWMDGH